jgi:hypothetical protein
LKDELDQTRAIKSSVENQFRSILPENDRSLEKRKHSTNQQHAANGSALETTPRAHYIEKLESIVEKAAALQKHTQKFQEKHASAWNGVGQSIPASMDSECKRLLDANTYLCQKIARVLHPFF